MITKILKINPLSPDVHIIMEAAKIIKTGGIVAFPTETVYGLGADALNPQAVSKIFSAKDRPADDPLIVHIAERKDLLKLVKKIPRLAQILIDNFWPGPLTLIFKKLPVVPEIVTSHLDTVAIRMPSNITALSLIKTSQTPIAAPSANLFGRPSPTNADHVKEDLNNRIDVILDAGSTDIGVESTVLDVTERVPVLLRPGGITKEQIEAVIGRIKVPVNIFSKKEPKLLKSPGLKYKHYSPKAKVILIRSKNYQEMVFSLIEKYRSNSQKVVVLTTNEQYKYPNNNVIFIGNNNLSIAHNLFRYFRDLDKINTDIIIVEGIDERGMGMAIINRLIRAADQII